MADASSSSSQTISSSEPPPLSGFPLALLTLGLALGTFMEVLDTSIANVAIPSITGNLGVAISQGTWVISSYAVASAIAVPLTGWLARRIGEVRLFASSVILFTLASILCGFAHNFEALIAFRLLQGLVSGPMVPLSQTILLRSYPEKRRGLALGLWAMTVIVAPIFGPLLSGWITENHTWPWIFYINVPVGLFSAFICITLLRGRETKIIKQRIDVVGIVLLILGVGSLQMMLDLGKDHDWFNSSLILLLAIFSAITLSLMLIWEITEKNPIIDLSLFKDRNFSLGTLIVSLGFMAFFGSVVIFPLWLQTVMGYTASLAGQATALIGLFALVLTPLIGGNLHKLNLRMTASFAFIIFAIVSYCNSLLNLETPFSYIAPLRLLQGIGTACFFVPMTTITLSSINTDRLASAAGLSNFLRTLAGAIGTAISTTFWENNAIYHHARLNESISAYSANTQEYIDKLAQLGITGQAAYGNLEKTVSQQAYMMSTNDFFLIIGTCFLTLSALVWITKPKKTAAPVMGH